MDDETRIKCLQLTKKLKKTSVFAVFKTTQDLKDAFPTIPISNFSSFRDLNGIQYKLETKSYRSENSWEHDIQLIWINSISIAAKNNLPLLNAIGIEFRDISQKLISSMKQDDNQKYFSEIAKLSKQLNQLTYFCPAELSNAFTIPKNLS